jgi:hypothetical protein
MDTEIPQHSATGEDWSDNDNAGTSAEPQAFKRVTLRMSWPELKHELAARGEAAETAKAPERNGFTEINHPVRYLHDFA